MSKESFEYNTGSTDTMGEEHKIELSEEEKYLGDFITTDGKNTRNIKARHA